MGKGEVMRSTPALKKYVNLHCKEDAPTADSCYEFVAAISGPAEDEINKVKIYVYEHFFYFRLIKFTFNIDLLM